MQQQMTNAEYHARPELSASQCVKLLENACRFKFSIGEDTEQTTPMLLGSAVHKLVLEPDEFNSEFAIYDGKARRGKSFEEFKSENEAKNILLLSEYQSAEKMAESVLKSPAKLFLQQGHAEQSYFGEIDGIKCRCRPDYYIPGANVIIDLKTCKDASPDGFARSVVDRKYTLQAAFYIDVLASIGVQIDRFFFLCVESSKPYAVGMYELDEKDLALGRWQYQQAFENYRNLDAYKKPIYLDSEDKKFIQRLHLPAYAYTRYNQVMEYSHCI